MLTKQSTRDRYEGLSVLRFASDEPNFRWCVNPSCGSGAVWRGGEKCHGLIRCRDCDAAQCFRHGLPWEVHIGMSCRDYDQTIEEATRSFLERRTKKCPNCSVLMMKGDACFHMTCKSGQGPFSDGKLSTGRVYLLILHASCS